jgi:hypothetical protein
VGRVHVSIGNGGRRQVTLQANRVDVCQIQKLGILTAMRRVTCRTARLSDRSVFVDPWTSKIRVALQTRGSLLRNPRLEARFKCVVRIMTFGAPGGAIIDFVMDRRGELCLNRGVTLIAKGRLRGLQKLTLLACMD